MNLPHQSAAFLATCGGDTVKIFDVSKHLTDPCILSYSPSPGSQVNSVKWNHTNLVVASAGEDKKISLWHKNGFSLGILPSMDNETGDGIDESITAISFSNKGSRYLCSGGSAQVVRIWDLQRKRCIKWLRGHTETITGVMYNCRDEHLASINLKGDLILHNLASGGRAAELKDPYEQVLRVLDYSRISRHLVVTAGDDGSIHLWDTSGRSLKISWTKEHSAPVTGVCFSPSNDKVIASTGLDKKLHLFDTGIRRPSFSISYESPFSSLAFRDDGWTLAAGTNNGRVVFYDVRGKIQPITVLCAYSGSEAVISLCWQKLKPVLVNDANCTAESALFGTMGEESVLMPDQLLPLTTNSGPGSRGSVCAVSTMDDSLLRVSKSGSTVMIEETPQRNDLLPVRTLERLQAPHSYSNLNDDMDIFSPVTDVPPMSPSLAHWWEDKNVKNNNALEDKKPISLLPPTRFSLSGEGMAYSHPLSDWRSLRQEAVQFAYSTTSTSVAPLKNDSSFLSPTPEEPSPVLNSITSSLGARSIVGSGVGPRVASPKSKNTRTETKEVLASRPLALLSAEAGRDVEMNGLPSQAQVRFAHAEDQHGASTFTLQLVQRTLEETVMSLQKSIHEDLRNLHIELLRQFHIQEVETSRLLVSVLKKQQELMKEVKLLRKENQQLRQLL